MYVNMLTLGPNVYKQGLLWAIWSLRGLMINSMKGSGSQRQNAQIRTTWIFYRRNEFQHICATYIYRYIVIYLTLQSQYGILDHEFI